MQFQASLTDTVRAQAEAGRNFTQIAIVLAIELGYALPVAQRIVEAVLYHDNHGHRLFTQAPGDAPMPDIDTGAQTGRLNLGDRHPTVRYEQLAPRLVLLDGFLSVSECEQLCAAASQRMQPAIVLDSADHSFGVRAARNNDSALFGRAETPLLATIENRIARATGWPVEHGEPLQVQRYQVASKFEPHTDYFDPQHAMSAYELAHGGQRVATVILYLRAPDAGGATYLANLGVRVMPRAGSALFFSYPEASMQSGTLHAGDPILAGEKWIATKWLRQQRTANWMPAGMRPPAS